MKAMCNNFEIWNIMTLISLFVLILILSVAALIVFINTFQGEHVLK